MHLYMILGKHRSLCIGTERFLIQSAQLNNVHIVQWLNLWLGGRGIKHKPRKLGDEISAM